MDANERALLEFVRTHPEWTAQAIGGAMWRPVMDDLLALEERGLVRRVHSDASPRSPDVDDLVEGIYHLEAREDLDAIAEALAQRRRVVRGPHDRWTAT